MVAIPSYILSTYYIILNPPSFSLSSTFFTLLFFSTVVFLRSLLSLCLFSLLVCLLYVFSSTQQLITFFKSNRFLPFYRKVYPIFFALKKKKKGSVPPSFVLFFPFFAFPFSASPLFPFSFRLPVRSRFFLSLSASSIFLSVRLFLSCLLTLISHSSITAHPHTHTHIHKPMDKYQVHIHTLHVATK